MATRRGPAFDAAQGYFMHGRIIRVIVIIAVFIFAGVSFAQAASPSVKIDFSFVAGGRTMTAGTYTVDIAADCKVVLASEKGGAPMELASIKTLTRKVSRTELVFDVVGSVRILSEALLPGKGGCQVNRHPDSQELQTVKGDKPAK
jgi:hypothetical protein